MNALDFESFEFRAAFFNRTLDEELVGCLDGPRDGEARMRLLNIAEQRRVNIEELIRHERERDSARPLRPHNETCECATVSRPKRVFSVDECPICTDADDFCVLECGHVVCLTCIGELKRRCRRVVCPTCRAPSHAEWSMEAVELANRLLESAPPNVGKRGWARVKKLLGIL